MKNSKHVVKNLFPALKHLKVFKPGKNSYLNLFPWFSLRLCVVAAFSLMLFTGCESDSDDLLLEKENNIEVSSGIHLNEKGEAAGIFDGANGGNEGFYFLPPMVKSPSYNGTFDAGLSPIVEIYEALEDETLHATFSMDEGEGSELVRVEDEGEHYIVNWHTDKTGTEVGKTYRIRISVAGSVLGYADVQMAENGKDAKNLTDGEAIGLVDGRTLPIKFRIEVGAVNIIGSEGGSFTGSDGLVNLEFPENAINEEIGITVTPVEDELDDPDVVPGALFDFGPSPYNFNEEVILTIKYDPANLPEGIEEEELRLLAVVDGEWVQLPGSSVDIDNSTVTGPLNSFSRKGVGKGKAHEIAVVPAEASIDVGETLQFEADMTNVDGEEMDRKVQWSSSDEEIATVDNSGLVTAVALGEVTIEAKSGKVSGTALLTVESQGPVVTRIEVTPVNSSIEVGATQQFTATVYDQNDEVIEGQVLTWTSSDEAIAIVDTDGIATGLSSGAATIRSTVGEISGSSELTVTEELGIPEILPETITTGTGHSCGLDINGVAYCWGRNGDGQLGNGSTTNQTTPVAVSMPQGVTFSAISAGQSHTVALSVMGVAYAWGANDFGKLGDGTTTRRVTPVVVSMPVGKKFSKIHAGSQHNLALTSSGTAYAWGSNSWGQLGDGTTMDRNTPVPILMPDGENFVAIHSGSGHTVALTSTGEAFAWGWNTYGQLGNGNTADIITPSAVIMPAGVKYITISSGGSHNMALTSMGEIYGWGRNNYGQLGDGTTTDRTSPVEVSTPEGQRYTTITTGGSFTIALTPMGEAYAWGYNWAGNLGDGTTTTRYTPVAVSIPIGVTFSAITADGSHVLALTPGGAAYTWGLNSSGQLGDNTLYNRRIPVLVSGSIIFAQ